jgi:DNA-binding NarL/FixJ family response regulator
VGGLDVSLDSTSPEDESALAYFSFAERERVDALLIDRDVADAAIIHRLAAKSKHIDFCLKSCASIDDARQILSEQTFDIVYVDYWMGDETSLAFIHEFSTMHDVPLVLLTGLDEPDIRRIAFRAGARGFLSKEEISTQAIEGVTLTALGARAQN